MNIVTRDNQSLTKSLLSASELERQELAKAKSQFSQSGGIDNNQHQARYAIYTSSGGQKTIGGGDDKRMSYHILNGISFATASDNDNDLSILKKDNLPFNWSK